MPAQFLHSLQRHIHQNFDLKKIRRIAAQAAKFPTPKPYVFRERKKIDVRIAIPYDRAIHFYYQDNLDLLEFYGAELIRFKPSEGEPLPDRVDGIYMGGGFPEVYASQISGNRKFFRGLKQQMSRGAKIYAECGGLMCLTKEIVDFEEELAAIR
jgi:cobyrinic acid a,c-diamide synthase